MFYPVPTWKQKNGSPPRFLLFWVGQIILCHESRGLGRLPHWDTVIAVTLPSLHTVWFTFGFVSKLEALNYI